MIFFTLEYDDHMGVLISIYLENIDFWIVQPPIV